MALGALPGAAGRTMTAKTGCGIDSSVDAMPGEIVAAMRRPSLDIAVIAQRGLQTGADAVTIRAKRRAMAHLANRSIVSGGKPVIVTERECMVEQGIPECLRVVVIMAIGAHGSAGRLFRMAQRQIFSGAACPAQGNQGKHGGKGNRGDDGGFHCPSNTQFEA